MWGRLADAELRSAGQALLDPLERRGAPLHRADDLGRRLSLRSAGTSRRTWSASAARARGPSGSGASGCCWAPSRRRSPSRSATTSRAPRRRWECAGTACASRSSRTCSGCPRWLLPAGVDGGLPQGVQLIGPRYREDRCLAAAQAIEDRLGVITPIEPREAARAGRLIGASPRPARAYTARDGRTRRGAGSLRRQREAPSGLLRLVHRRGRVRRADAAGGPQRLRRRRLPGPDDRGPRLDAHGVHPRADPRAAGDGSDRLLHRRARRPPRRAARDAHRRRAHRRRRCSPSATSRNGGIGWCCAGCSSWAAPR